MTDTFENIISKEELKASLQRAFRQVADILIQHSGPFATNSLIGSRFRQVNDVDEFTKDGINILRHLIVSEDPGARFAVRVARYIGIAVDSRCHDGTTTSMLLCCLLANVALERLDDEPYSSERYGWVEDLHRVLNECLEFLSSYRITDEDIFKMCQVYGIETSIEDVRGAMAFHMAMISSKGDEDLSRKISSIIRASPKKIYGMFRNIPLAVETEEAYIIKRQEFDLAINANIGNMQDYNHRNDTQYLSENAVIFATANDISAHSMEGGFLASFISDKPKYRADLSTFGVEHGWEHYHEDKRHLIIMTPLMADPNLIQIISDFNSKNPTFKISWFQTQVPHRLRTSFNKTLHYMAGVPLFESVMMKDPVQSLIGLKGQNVRVNLLGSFLSISHLYERDGEVFHPFYRDPEAFPEYTEFVRETEEIIEFGHKNVTNPLLPADELNHLVSIYRSLTCQEIYDIEVGGSKHDQLANQTVYEDAIGAALSAVDEGVVLSGYAHLANHLQRRRIYKSTTVKIAERTLVGSLIDQWRSITNPPEPLCVTEGIEKALVELVLSSLRISPDEEGAEEYVHQLPVRRWSYLYADRALYRTSTKASHYVCVGELDSPISLERFLAQKADHIVLLQAFGGYDEQFKRFGSILPKLANTSVLVDMRRDGDAGGA